MEAFTNVDITRLAKDKVYREGFTAGYQAGIKVGAALTITLSTVILKKRAVKLNKKKHIKGG